MKLVLLFGIFVAILAATHCQEESTTDSEPTELPTKPATVTTTQQPTKPSTVTTPQPTEPSTEPSTEPTTKPSTVTTPQPTEPTTKPTTELPTVAPTEPGIGEMCRKKVPIVGSVDVPGTICKPSCVLPFPPDPFVSCRNKQLKCCILV